MAGKGSRTAGAGGADGTRRLVIVESPTKAKKISGYLGAGYEVDASVGHIRDLPTPSELPPELKKGRFGRFAVDVDNGFEPYYVVDADKRKKVAELKRALKDADELFLATDEDREGEAIAWHLLQVLDPRVPVRRMVFHEITADSIAYAVANTRELDQHLVDAQETRRILDRLYGYEVSPVLWRKVRAGLSAGRVQSVATRLTVERERERIAFRSASYWDLDATLESAGTTFPARLVAVDGAKVATGRDFSDVGVLTTAGAVALTEDAVGALSAALDAAAFTVTSVEDRPYSRKPAAPFMTSTLQQEASRKLRMSTQSAMRVAQRLYENGYITYMRTDSTTLSEAALGAARAQARELYGPEYVPDVPRRYARKVKNAQEAHEAIRPSGDVFRTPGQLAGELRGDEFAMYELIWKRTVASQMADARGQTASVRFTAPAEPGVPGNAFALAEFAASGTVITFRGFMAAYEEGRDDDEAARSDAAEAERRLPVLRVQDLVAARELVPAGHTTSPPARYTEATLIKEMVDRGIGRPSTYASIIGTILDRGYVVKRGSALVPSWLAFAVTKLLEEHFGDLVDYDFTAEMEGDLDRIASGDADRAAWLSQFYFGGADPASPASVTRDGGGPDALGGLQALVENLGDIDAREVNTVDIGEGITLRVGRYGPFIERGDERASVPEELAPDELTVARAEELLSAPSGDRELGEDPSTGRQVVAKGGRYGPYVTEVLSEAEEAAPPKSRVKARTASLFSTMTLDTVTLDDALVLLTLPRLVGLDPESGEEITAQNGRYGPYLKRGTDSRSLQTEDQLLTIELPEALAVYAQPKQRGRAAAAPPLKEFGPDPVSGRPIVVKSGRFGAYATDGETNATLQRDDDSETLTFERAVELLADKRARGPAPKKKAAAKKAPAAKKAAIKKTAAGTTAAGKTVAKKTVAKKTVAKKTVAKKTVAKKTAATRATAAR